MTEPLVMRYRLYLDLEPNFTHLSILLSPNWEPTYVCSTGTH